MRPEQLQHPDCPRCPRCKYRHLAGARCWVGDYARGISQHILATQGRTCWVCGGLATAADHVIPRSLGGSDRDENLRPICKPCNTRKKNGQNPFGPDQAPAVSDVPLSSRWSDLTTPT